MHSEGHEPCISLLAAHQAVIVDVQDVHGVPDAHVDRVQLLLNALQDGSHLAGQSLGPHRVLQLWRLVHLHPACIGSSNTQSVCKCRVGLGVPEAMLGPTLPLMPQQACLYGSGVPRDHPLKGHLL